MGVRGETVEELEGLSTKYKLNFPLRGDTARKTLRAYGVWQNKLIYGIERMGTVRATYIIDPKGKVRQVLPKAKVEGHVQELLRALKR